MSTPSFIQYGPSACSPAAIAAIGADLSFLPNHPVHSSAPVLTVGLTHSGSGANADSADFTAFIPFLVDITNARGGVWLQGTQYQLSVLMADDQSSVDYMALLYARLEEQLGVQLFFAPYGDLFIQSLSARMAQSNGTFVVGAGSDPADYFNSTGNLWDFINTSDLNLRQSLGVINVAAKSYSEQIASGAAKDDDYVSAFGVTTICAFTANASSLLQAQRSGLLAWIENENAIRRAEGALAEVDFVHLVVDVSWPDNAESNTYAIYYSLCPDNTDVVVAMAHGGGHISGLAASLLRPKVVIGWTIDDFSPPSPVDFPNGGGFTYASDPAINTASGIIIPVSLSAPVQTTLPSQPFVNIYEMTDLFSVYCSASNLSDVQSVSTDGYGIAWSTLMASINASTSTQRHSMTAAILSLQSNTAVGGLLEFNNVTGVNVAELGIVLQCHQASLSCDFLSADSLPPYPFPWPWHQLVAGDEITSAQTTSPILLAVVMAVLGAWVAQIIAEQAIFSRRRGGRQYMLWLVVVAVSLGGVGIWSSMLMQSTALTTALPASFALVGTTDGATLTVDWSLEVVLLAWLPSILLTYCGLLFMVHDIPSNHDTGRTDQASVAARTMREQKEAKMKQAALSHRQHLSHLISAFSLRLCLGSALVVAAVILTRVTLWYAWQQPAAFQSMAWAWAVTTIMDAVFITLAMLMFIHALRWRIPAVFLFATIVTADWQIQANGLNFSYQPVVSTAVSPYVSSTAVTLVAGLIAALICFVFIGLQFSAMKLSRNDLTVLVLSLKAALHRLKDQAAKDQAQIQQLRNGGRILAAMIHTVNLVATLPQEYIFPVSIFSGVPHLSVSQPLDRKASLQGSIGSASSERSTIKSSDGALVLRSDRSSSHHVQTSGSVHPTPEPLRRGSVESFMIETCQKHSPVTDLQYETAILTALESQHQHISEHTVSGQMNKTGRSTGVSATCFLGCSEEGSFSIAAHLLGKETTNGSTKAAEGPSLPSLETILGHPVALEVFKQELIKTKSVESLVFCLHARRYASISSAKARRLLATSITDTFIRAGSPQQVNISNRQCEHIVAAVDRRSEDACTPVLFHDAQRECVALMRTNAWNSFSASSGYRLCAWICSSLDVNEAVDAFAAASAAPNGSTGVSWLWDSDLSKASLTSTALTAPK